MIVRAMQACGAIFVKTPVAQAFVEKLLATSRDILVHEFVRAHLQSELDATFSLNFIQAKPSQEQHPKHQIHVIMTLLFLQTIGLFHQDPQQRASSSIYHGMLVLVRSLFMVLYEKLIFSKMVRQNHLIERTATWEPQAFPTNDPDVLEATWRDWALHEALKRYLIVSCLKASAPGSSYVFVVWFPWYIVTIKHIVSTSRCRRHSHQKNSPHSCHVMTNYGEPRPHLSGHNYSSVRPPTAVLRSGYAAYRCSARSPPLV